MKDEITSNLVEECPGSKGIKFRPIWVRNERDMLKQRRRGRVWLRRGAAGQNSIVLVITAQPCKRTTGGRVVQLVPREGVRSVTSDQTTHRLATT